jgi:DNA primase
MSGLIPQHFIDDLLSRTDIVAVIDQRVPLKKKGREYAACCPFHGEKTPSFYVSPDKQFYHCFGCGVHGTAISFLMEYDHLSFVEAIEALAEEAGVEVPREVGSTNAEDHSEQTLLYEVMQAATTFFQRQLRQYPEAVDYLKRRGLSGETARDFLLGYAPPGWDSLQNDLSERYSEKILLKAGLLSQNEQGRIYDKFRERIMFPILDHRGRVVAFGGRVMGNGEPKYLNSPESPIFHKGKTLYGLYEAKKNNPRLDSLLVVEGYMDCLALVQHGITHAVATLGTATTREHLQQLFRTVKRVIVCFDGDKAGRAAAWRALEQALPVLRDDLEVDFLFLPEGEDPDSLLQKEGSAGFRDLLERAVPLSTYLLDSLRQRHDTSAPEGRSRLGLEGRKLLQSLTPGLLRDQLTRRVAELADVDQQKLMGRQPVDNSNPTRRQSHSQTLKMTAMRQAIACLLQNPELAQRISEEQLSRLHKLPGGEVLSQLVDIIQANPNATIAILLEHFRDSPHIKSVAQLSIWRPPKEEEISRLLDDALSQLGRQARDMRLEELLTLSREGGLDELRKTELKQLLQHHSTGE